MDIYNIYIRPLIKEDAQISYQWRNDKEIWKMTGFRPNREITYDIELEWINKVLADTTSNRFAIIADEKYIGNVQLTDLTEKTGQFHIFIGDKSYWGKGIAFTATYQLLHYAKYKLNLDSVYLYVKNENIAAIKAYRSAGFKDVEHNGGINRMEIELIDLKPPMVSVFVMVYNHEAYLRECLDGLLVQKCNFTYNIVVGEDKSPDNSREILLEYQSKYPGYFRLLLHEENIGALANQNIVLNTCDGKYIAICEGDDYWIDPLKLQKQVDYLEAHDEVVACGTYIHVLKDKLESFEGKLEKEVFFHDDLLKGKWLPTLTMMFRKDGLMNAVAPILDDFTLLLNLSSSGQKLVKLPFVSAVYRYHGAGIVSGAKLHKQIKRANNSLYIYTKHLNKKDFTDKALANISKRMINTFFSMRKIEHLLAIRQLINDYWKVLKLKR